MKKILFVTMEFPPDRGGVSRYYENICASLKRVECTILAPYSSCVYADRRLRIKRRRFFTRFFWPHWLPLFWQVFSELWRGNYDVVVAGQILPVGLVVFVLSRVFSLPFVVFVHGMDIFVPLRSPRKRFFLRFILKRSSMVFAASTFTKEQVLSLGVPQDSVTVLTPAVSAFSAPPRVKQKSFSERKNFSILSVGRLVARKGFDTVLRALPALLAVCPDVRYVLIGSGEYQDTLLSIIHELQLEKYVRIFEHVSDVELVDFYADADVFAMPNRRVGAFDMEGFGIVFLEAALFGKPSIAGRDGGASDAVLHERTGLIVHGENVSEVTEALIRLYTNADFRIRLGEQARMRVERDFQWRERAKRFEDCMEAL